MGSRERGTGPTRGGHTPSHHFECHDHNDGKVRRPYLVTFRHHGITPAHKSNQTNLPARCRDPVCLLRHCFSLFGYCNRSLAESKPGHSTALHSFILYPNPIHIYTKCHALQLWTQEWLRELYCGRSLLLPPPAHAPDVDRFYGHLRRARAAATVSIVRVQ